MAMNIMGSFYNFFLNLRQRLSAIWLPISAVVILLALFAVAVIGYRLIVTSGTDTETAAESVVAADSNVTQKAPVPSTQDLTARHAENRVESHPEPITPPPLPAVERPPITSLYGSPEVVAQKIETFESEVLKNTHAVRVRVETPQLVNPQEYDSNSVGSAPGYVAFMASPQAMEEGVYHTMVDIAQHYFGQFPEAQRVTVALVIGGGVRERETFFNNWDGTVRLGGTAE
jgi:hypothetical protein